MPRHFYLPQPLTPGTVLLSGREAHHLAHVLRLQPGDHVRVFNGEGAEARAEITAVSPSGVVLNLTDISASAGELDHPLVLATAVPKGDRFSWLVEKATELGVSRLLPLITDRSIVDPGTGKLERLRHTIIAASKQCGRTRLMTLDEPTPWKSFLATLDPAATFLLAHPAGEPWTELPPPAPGPHVVAIGPEGGLTDREVDSALAHGARLVTLGPRILRIETAGLALAALLGCR